MTTRLAINGFGRIGRCVLRALFESDHRSDLRVVAINEPADCKTIAHLLKYDSTHGTFPQHIACHGDQLTVGDQIITIFHEEQIDQLPWGELGIDIVLECSGRFSDRRAAENHLHAGAQKVLFSHPANSQEDVDNTIVYGFNHPTLTADQRIISNASCSTNCVVPVIKLLHDAFEIDSGVITTIHSAMNDQPVIDAYHHTDLRKTRSAMHSIIPVDTGLALGIDRLLPALAGRFEAQAMRVPTINVSAIDLSVVVKKEASTAVVNRVLREGALQQFDGVLGYSEELLASCDFNHDPRSGIVDASQTRVAGSQLVKVLVWFDNEWGFSNRMLDTAKQIARR